MSRVNKNRLRSSIIVVIVLVAISVSLYYLLRPPGIGQMSRSFQSNREEIQLVTDYLLGTNFESNYVAIQLNEVNTHGAVEM